jgi:hypothetical protein
MNSLKGAPGKAPLSVSGPIFGLERNPEKWKPVFRRIARKSRNLGHDPIQSEWIMA